MEKYLSEVSEMYSQFKKKEAHPMEKYIGRLARSRRGDVVFKECEHYWYVSVDDLIE